MPQTIGDVMTRDLCTVRAGDSVTEAARLMKERDIGDVIVLDGDEMCGIVTDRDVVVRTIAEGRDPQEVKIGEICSKDLVTVTTDDAVDHAVELMRDRAVRRLPVVEGGRPVGVVSIGDLAMERDPSSALADISAAPGNA